MRGITCRCVWNTVWPAGAPSARKKFTPSQGKPDWRSAAATRRPSAKHAAAARVVEAGEVGRVMGGNHQHVAVGDGRDVHERDGVLVAVDDARRHLAGDDLAEDAVFGRELLHATSRPMARAITSSGAFLPVKSLNAAAPWWSSMWRPSITGRFALRASSRNGVSPSR